MRVTASYRQYAMQLRDYVAIHANPDLLPKNEAQETAKREQALHGRPPSEGQREAQDDMATFAAMIGNLKAIETLVRALAKKLGVSLIEPGPGRE